MFFCNCKLCNMLTNQFVNKSFYFSETPFQPKCKENKASKRTNKSFSYQTIKQRWHFKRKAFLLYFCWLYCRKFWLLLPSTSMCFAANMPETIARSTTSPIFIFLLSLNYNRLCFKWSKKWVNEEKTIQNCLICANWKG